jgi:CRP-like cAMP-binding protein
MSDLRQTTVRNNLLRVMSAETFESIRGMLEWIELPRHFGISNPHETPTHAYFPEFGLASVVARSPEGQHTEIGVLGRDGMTPTSLILDAGSDPFAIFMQVAGAGFRIEATALSKLLAEDREMQQLFLRYAQALAVQGAYTALSNAVHHIHERLARWILMCHDRTDGNEISLTHEFLSIMLAVRRPSVTTALHVLEGNKLIYSERGVIIIRDRRGLELFAKDAYGECEREYERLIGVKP